MRLQMIRHHYKGLVYDYCNLWVLRGYEVSKSSVLIFVYGHVSRK